MPIIRLITAIISLSGFFTLLSACYGPPERVEDTRDPSSDYYGMEYPFPFSPASTIEFEVSDSAYVTLEIFNVEGEKVHLLLDGLFSPGRHSAAWDASGQLSGVYFYKITEIGIPSGDTTVTTKKMILLK